MNKRILVISDLHIPFHHQDSFTFLQEIKKDKDFADLALVKQSRLSVMRIDLKSWKKICRMGKV